MQINRYNPPTERSLIQDISDVTSVIRKGQKSGVHASIDTKCIHFLNCYTYYGKLGITGNFHTCRDMHVHLLIYLRVNKLTIHPSNGRRAYSLNRALASSFEVSESHRIRHTDSSGRVISPSQRPLPTQDNTTYKHKKQISMSSAGFEPAILATKRPQTYALDRAATGIGYYML
jgi:hypothetical protein